MLHLGCTYLVVKEMKKSAAFYEALLQMRPTHQNYDRWIEFAFEGRCIALYCNDYDERLIASGKDLKSHYSRSYISFLKERKITYGNQVVLNFWVEDLDEEYKRLEALSIGELSEMMYLNIALPYDFFMIYDPDGNMIEITGKRNKVRECM